MRHLIYLTLFLCLVACTNNDELSDLELSKLDGVVLRERPADNVWKPFVYNENEDLTRSSFVQPLSMKDYLGYSFRNDIIPFQDTRNLGYRVIDVPNFSKDYPNYFLSWQNRSHEAKVCTFNSFDDYVSKSETTKKVEHGFDLKLFCFNIGHKHEYTSIFGQNIIGDSKSVFGELNIIFRDSCYRMQYSSNIQKEIIKKYLDKTFIKELHSMHPYDVFKRYGGFVAADYSSGGCASAFYAGLYKKDTFESNRETNLSREINASYTWDDNSTSGNLKIGRGGKSNLSITGTFSSVLVSVKTLGGNASGGCSMPQEVGNSSVDLSSWISSLSDKSTDVIADFNQNGLIPISEFILERNLRNSLNFYINNEPNNTPSIGAPYILVFEYGSLNNPPAKIYAAWLMTRYGENLDLNKVKVANTNNDNAEFWQWIDDLASIFQIKIFNLGKFS